MGIILGLTGAVCWGISDFCARFSSRRIGAYRTLFFMQLIGFLALSAYMKFTGGFGHRFAPGWQPWVLAAVAGVLNVIASLALYYSFQVGVMSIVGPVSSSYPALTVALAVASGERIHALRGIGLGVTLLGVILASTSFVLQANPASTGLGTSPHAHLTKGVGWAIVAALGFGFLFWFLGFHVVPVVGSVLSVWVIRVTAFSTLALVAAPARQSLRLPGGNVWWLLVGIGVLDTAAFVAGNAGLAVGPVSVVTVLVSLYGAVTLLLSWIFLRERLERSQWFGVALIFAGIVVVSR